VPTSVLTGPGVTGTSITIGIQYVDAAAGSSYASSLGVKGATLGDVRAQAKALQAYVNSHGGLAAGRKLQLVMRPIDYSQSLPANAQAACADFTQDHKVYAAFSVLLGNFPDDTLVPCLARAGVMTVSGALVPGSEKAFFQRYRSHYYAPGQFESVAAARTYVTGLHSAGYFRPGARIGLLYWDLPAFREALNEGLTPALRRHGLSVAATRAIPAPQATSDMGSTASAIQGAALRFQTDRVDHVLFLDSGGGLAQYFMIGAQNQQYFPRYGLSSDSNLPLLEANANPSQLKGALAVGWQPTLDVGESRLPRTPAAQSCDRIMSAAGIRPASGLDHWVTYRLCSGIFFLQQALRRAPDWSLAGFRAGVERLGASPESNSLGYAERYGPGKYWGGHAYRSLSYREPCACFDYTSGPTTVR
jgi:hypothetical protein